MSDTDHQPLFRVEDLRVSFDTDDGVVHAVDGISYQVQAGKTIGIVGESGSGKSVSSLTALGLTRGPRTKIEGRILFEDQDLVSLDDDHLRRVAILRLEGHSVDEIAVQLGRVPRTIKRWLRLIRQIWAQEGRP